MSNCCPADQTGRTASDAACVPFCRAQHGALHGRKVFFCSPRSSFLFMLSGINELAAKQTEGFPLDGPLSSIVKR